jgi:hypothetical protein
LKILLLILLDVLLLVVLLEKYLHLLHLLM